MLLLHFTTCKLPSNLGFIPNLSFWSLLFLYAKYFLHFLWYQSFLNMQLYEKALDLFEDDPPTLVSSSLTQEQFVHKFIRCVDEIYKRNCLGSAGYFAPSFVENNSYAYFRHAFT